MRKLMYSVACAAAIISSHPAAAQRSYDLGPIWNIGMIDVEDGQFETYMDWLNGQWKANQQFAKQQGWLLDYHILANDDKRVGEPDLYLITRYADEPSNAEIRRRDAIMLQRMQKSPKVLDKKAASA